MGLGSKSKTTTKQKTTEQATRTPTNPAWVTDAMKGYTGKVMEFGNRDPQSLVAGPTDLQQQAWAQAGQMGDWRNRLEGMGTANTALGANLGPAQTAAAATAGNVNLGPANMADAATYDVRDPGNPTFSKPTQLGDAAQAQLGDYAANERATAEGYTAAQAAAERARAEQAKKYLGDYLNPYLSDVVDTTMADFDANAGQVRAQQAAAAARNGAFGGSRYGIQEAATEGELARGRASTAAGLRSNAYEFAGQMGAADADRFADVSKYNASLGTQTNIANAGFTNDARAFGANARNQASIFNAGQTNARNANLFNTETANNQFNTGQRNDFAVTQGQMDQQNNQFNADTQNQAVRDYMARLDSAGQFNAGQQQQNSQFNAGQGNQFALTAAQLAQQNNQFNAGQRDAALGRNLQAAALEGEGTRADISLGASLGEQQRQIEQQRALAELMQLQSMGNLLGSANFGLFNGQTVNSTGTVDGTQTSKSSPGLMGVLGSGLMGASMLGWAPFATGGS